MTVSGQSRQATRVNLSRGTLDHGNVAPTAGLERNVGQQAANSGHSSRTLNFLHSGHWNDLRGTEGIASEPHRHLTRKLQLPLDRLEARLLAQGVQERVGLQCR
jgi:hypothetical protein